MPESFAIQFPTYLHAMRIITDISNANPAIVTTSFSNSYISGEIVRIVMPYEHGYFTWGMQQINDQTGTIEVIDDTHFYIDIDTTLYEPFITIIGGKQRPFVVPIGEVNPILTAATQNVL